jgi:hypothetical protein
VGCRDGAGGWICLDHWDAAEHDWGACQCEPDLLVVGAVILGALFLCSIGSGQWLVLRRHVPRAALWVLANGIAWLLGVAVPVVGLSLLPDGVGPLVMLVVGVLCGLAMGLIVGAITGIALAQSRSGAGVKTTSVSLARTAAPFAATLQVQLDSAITSHGSGYLISPASFATVSLRSGIHFWFDRPPPFARSCGQQNVPPIGYTGAGRGGGNQNAQLGSSRR